MMKITHEFDEYNNLMIIITYHGLTFRYQFCESYLLKDEEWDYIIKYVEKSKTFTFDSGDVQSWNDTLSLAFPKKYKGLYIKALNEARKDPRINTIVDRNF